MQKEVEGNKRITQCMGCMEIYEAFDVSVHTVVILTERCRRNVTI